MPLPELLLRHSRCLLVILCLGFSFQTAAQSASEDDWTYTSRPGEELKMIGQRFLAPGIEWTRLIQHNRLGEAFKLPAGTAIRIPVQWLRQSPEPARVLSVSGEAWLRRARESAFRSLQADTLILVGDEIKTGNGSASVGFSDDSEIDLSGQTQVIFNRLTRYGETGMSDTRFKLLRGHVENRVTPRHKPAGRFEVTTPGAVAAVRGTVFRVEAEEGLTRTEVIEGQVEVSNATGSQTLQAGEGAAIRNQGTIRPEDLLEAPIVSLPAVLNTLPYTISWEPRTDAVYYHVSLAREESGQVLVDRRISEATLTLNNYPNGAYELRLRAVAESGLDGLVSETRFRIERAASPAQLIEPVAGTQVNKARPLFRWETRSTDQLASLEVSEREDFASVFTRSAFRLEGAAVPELELPAGEWYWRVVTLAGNDSFSYSEARPLTVIRELESSRIIATNYSRDGVRVFWEQVANASSYKLQISDDEFFQRIHEERDLEATNARLTLDPGKTWYLRVKGVGSGFYRSEYGPYESVRLPGP